MHMGILLVHVHARATYSFMTPALPPTHEPHTCHTHVQFKLWVICTVKLFKALLICIIFMDLNYMHEIEIWKIQNYKHSITCLHQTLQQISKTTHYGVRLV